MQNLSIVKINNHPVEEVSQIKHLEVVLNTQLSYKQQIDYGLQKVRQAMYYIYPYIYKHSISTEVKKAPICIISEIIIDLRINGMGQR